MTDPKLVYPSQEYIESYYGFCREMKDQNVTTFKMYDDPDMYEEWKHTIVQRCADWRMGKNLPDGWVPGSILFLVDEGEVVGEVSLRHELNDFLSRYAGHIGYGIRPSRWKQGYGTIQLKLALDEVRKLGLTKILISCNVDNEGSRRIIEKNGGVFDAIVPGDDADPPDKRRYWIAL